MTHPNDDDELDGGICDGPDAPRGTATADGDEALGLVLFADVETDDPDAVARREQEWRVLARKAP